MAAPAPSRSERTSPSFTPSHWPMNVQPVPTRAALSTLASAALCGSWSSPWKLSCTRWNACSTRGSASSAHENTARFIRSRT